MLLQLFFVLAAIVVGARLGGIGLGVLGGLGLAVLVFVFGLVPTAPPIDVMLMIVAVIAAAGCMQAAGGLDLMVAVPCTLAGVAAGAVYSLRVGKELEQDPEFLRRLAKGELETSHYRTRDVDNPGKALWSVILFLAATAGIVLFGSIEGLRPVFNVGGESVTMEMSHIIEILMLTAAGLILLVTRTDGLRAAQGSVFQAGMQAVVAIFGIAWMGDTFINGNMAVLKGSVEHLVAQMPWLFGIALFVMSILLFSQAATVRALLPLGISLGISPAVLIALFPAVNGYFFIPNYPTVVAAINFDRTGTTRIGKYVLNHSFMMPGLIATGVSVGLGLLLVQLM